MRVRATCKAIGELDEVDLLLLKPRRSRSAAASRQTFPSTICRSIGVCVRACVVLSSALWKNAGSGPDAVWHHRSHG